MSGINPNTKKPILWVNGHHQRVQAKTLAAARSAKARANWPSKETVQAALTEHGTQTSAADALGINRQTFRHIVTQLGVARKPHGSAMPKSKMRFGWSGEDHAALILGAELNRGTTGHETFDLTWQGRKIEVKTSRPVRAGAQRDWFWMFQVSRSQGKFDALFCIGCNADGLPRAYFLVPPSVVPSSKLSVPLSLRSKWAAYLWTPAPDLPAWLA